MAVWQLEDACIVGDQATLSRDALLVLHVLSRLRLSRELHLPGLPRLRTAPQREEPPGPSGPNHPGVSTEPGLGEALCTDHHAAGDPAVPAQPEVIDQPGVYAVWDILDSCRHRGRLEYLVDWEGYGPEERAWVACQVVMDPALLADFHTVHPGRPAPYARGRLCRSFGASGATPGGGGGVREHPAMSPVRALPTRSSSPAY
ncbi:chromo domain-containing protein cec-1-like [Tachysurus fulvidraco]|uniref:chromo domain-containing protein cec-1-like n=1 Tax=Tachysurus fulvidraco TaxID=1234273 RepID=UPI001FEFA30A|nr:chromo domain-containing protein cec-1-like [Tachysurus fulvidraco]